MSFNIHEIPTQKGRIAIVTGANDGLGFQTTLALSKTGMKVVMACRNQEKGDKAREEIIRQVPEANLELMHLDLSKLSSVHAFAKEYKQKHEQLDLLINNAGIMIPPYELTEDGFESQLGVNYLGHFLLTGLLLPLLEKASGSRVVSLSSNAHKNGKIHFDDLNFKKKYAAFAAYSQSKLACLIFAKELQRRLDKSGSKVLSVAAHPGMSDTSLFKHVPGFVTILFGWLIRLLMAQTAEDGAMPTLYAALGNDIQGGDYIGPGGWQEWKGKPVKVKGTKLSEDKEVAKKLWKESGKLTGCKFL
ncbi:MAG: oxidoreductase [Lentimicrobiaceae bacterium]|jgi:NAD(P)-dependent dehydrogenase (short-subunit alcohol dehydrogenase family)|nr:oxidoreductase [Lentimicrobiaceae bacterium]MDD4599247.1 oxidoreductase [Lentimicrobiaceae bacterium]MDY0027109.1 oxidoreductase [Lentimicrobium sp.]HAH58025.1 short-chain dehydrogenase [Bacteroidales bacterium]